MNTTEDVVGLTDQLCVAMGLTHPRDYEFIKQTLITLGYRWNQMEIDDVVKEAIAIRLKKGISKRTMML